MRETDLPPRPLRGRGAVSNPAGRFEPREVVPFDDGWGSLGIEPPRLETTVMPEATRRIITTNESPDVPFDNSINPYKGCEHGCVYCFARQTHAYLGLSAGLDFESKIFSKPDAPELLRRELGRRNYRCKVIAIGANTDPYQPIERRLKITRQILEVLAEHRHPFAIVTKSNLILRDVDLIGSMAPQGLAVVFVSITTLDLQLASRMEPRAPIPAKRLEALRDLEAAGVPTGVLASPMIPGLNDAELDAILEAAAAEGARWASYLLLRLPHEVEGLFVEWLETHYPARAAKVLGLLREMHGGDLYDSRYGLRMTGKGKYADLLRSRFDSALRRFGLDERRLELDTGRFRVPSRPGAQRRLFD